MHPEYGKQVGQAFAAVQQLHHDVSRLLTDTIPRLGHERDVNTAVVKGTSWQVNVPNGWMPYCVCLWLVGGDLPPRVAEVLMVYFWNPPPKPTSPHLVAARFEYKPQGDGQIKSDFWDAWNAWTKWDQPFPVGVVNRFSPPNNDRIESATLTAVPLFDIASVDDVLKLMEKVRAV